MNSPLFWFYQREPENGSEIGMALVKHFHAGQTEEGRKVVHLRTALAIPEDAYHLSLCVDYVPGRLGMGFEFLFKNCHLLIPYLLGPDLPKEYLGVGILVDLIPWGDFRYKLGRGLQ